MNNDSLIKIIENFRAQSVLYNQLLALSAKQMDLLNDNNNDLADDLHKLLIDRKTLLNEINSLNSINKTIQEAFISELKIEEFSLSKLEGLVVPELHQELSEVIAAMSTLLQQINDNDKVNEALIKQNARHKKSTSITKASSAYQDAMQNLDPKKS